MPYALFCNDAQISKSYPSEADVWALTQKSGLVVDLAPDGNRPGPRRILDNDYEIRPCPTGPGEDPARNKADAEQQASQDLDFKDVDLKDLELKDLELKGLEFNEQE